MKNFLPCLFLLSFFALKPYKSTAQVNKTDSLALVDLYDSANNYVFGWAHPWDCNTPVSTWYGVAVENKRVVSINLRYNHLWGNIPYSIGNLTKLRSLDLSHNQIEGVLPHTLGNLDSLETLRIGGNDDVQFLYTNITGGLPASLKNLHNLKTLNLSQAGLGGLMPAFLGSLIKLQTLDLSINGFTGSIPEEYGNLQMLQYLDLSYLSGVTGIIPSSLGKLRNLQSLYLSNDYNLSSQEIPDSLFMPNLIYLSLYNCHLKGKIPLSFSKMVNLKWIDLSFNKLNGNFPKFKFDSLYTFNIGNNNLKGNVLSSLINSPKLAGVYLNNNALSGSIPDNFFDLEPKLGIMDISYNNYSGNFPSSTSYNYTLRELYLNNNQFSGTIPTSIGNLYFINTLILSHNSFTGILPLLYNFYIYKIDISYNKFASPLSFLSYPNFLYIDSNRFNFSSLEAYAQYYNNNDYLYNYSPQAMIPIHYNNGILSVSAGGTLSNNTYKWYKGSKLIKTKTGDSTLEVTKGNYSVAVTNSIATKLTLYSDTFMLSASNFSATTTAKNNANIFTASVSPNPVSGATLNLFTSSSISINTIAGILNTNGEVVYKKQIEINSGKHVQTLNIGLLPGGIYYLCLDDSRQIASIKFIKN